MDELAENSNLDPIECEYVTSRARTREKHIRFRAAI